LHWESFEFTDFRNIEYEPISCWPGVNWLVGDNGQGKTNFLEAVYALSTVKSFRTPKIKQCRRKGSDSARLAGRLARGQVRRDIKLEIGKRGNRKWINAKPCETLDFIQQAAVIAFTSRSKALVEGSPKDRRGFLDRMMALSDTEHMRKMAKFRRQLRQLRGILHDSADLRLYRSFKMTLVGAAEHIVRDRLRFLEEMSQRASEIFASIFSEQIRVVVKYKFNHNSGLKEYQDAMMRHCAAEVLHRRMLMGPQLDDLSIELSGEQAKGFASSGQVRAVVLSLKLAVRDRFHELHGRYPVLLLDDIDAELDKKRLFRLLSYVDRRGQTFVSTSKYATIKDCEIGQAYRVNAGTFRLVKGI